MKRLFTIFLLLTLSTSFLYAQDVTVSLPVVEGEIGEMLLPISLSNAVNDVGAVSLKIDMDQNVAEYVGIENNSISGSFFNAKLRTDGILVISWIDLTPKNLTEKILDIKVNYKGGKTNLKFVETNKIANSGGIPFNVVFNNGEITTDVAKIGLESTTATIGSEIEIALSGASLTNVGAMNLNINYSDTDLEFLGLGTVNDAGFIAFANNGQVKLAMTSPSGYSIASGTMATLKFKVLKSTSNLTFNSSSVVEDINFNAISISYSSAKIEIPVGPNFIKTMPDTTVTAEKTLSYTYKADNPNDDVFEFKMVSGPDGAAIDASTGVFSWITSFNSDDENVIVIGLFVGTDMVDVDTAIVTVEKPDQTPSFTKTLGDVSINADKEFSFKYEGSQPQGKALVFALEQGPDGASVSTNGLFSWTPSYDSPDNNEIIVSLTSVEITVFDTAKVAVIKNNRAPVFIQKMPSDTTIKVSSWPVYISFLYKAEDPEGDAITFGIVDAPGDAAISESGTFTFTPEPEVNIGLYPYDIKITATDGNLTSESITKITLDVTVDVTSTGILPTEYSLEQNYPNPFNPTSTIQFALPKQSEVKLEVVNMIGQKVSTLVNSQLSAGIHTVNFNAHNLSSGIYLYKLTATAIDGSKVFNSMKKMVLMK